LTTENKGIYAVVFDMDGVLIDSHPAHLAAWREFLRSAGKEVFDDELSFVLEGRTRSEILRHFLGPLPERELEGYGRRKDEIFRALEYRIKLIPGVLEFLRNLNGQRIASAVATSASEIRTFSTIERMGMAEFFEVVVTASDVSWGKPDPMVYRLACERLAIAPQHALAFDDAPAGIRAARSAGLRCVGVASNGLAAQLLDAGAEQVIKDFKHLTLNDFAQTA
jgi:HAD superfamily hydrolase (TIGR01509 family)